MKTSRILWVILVIAAFLTGMKSQAQTTNTLPAIPGVGADVSKLGGDLWDAFLTMKPFTTNGEATVQIGAGKNLTSGEWIEVVAVTVPTSDYTAIGFTGFHIGNEWADGSVSLQLGMTNNLPVLGVTRSFIEAGPSYNFTTKQVGAFTGAGQQKEWVISTRWKLGVGYWVGNTSDRPGVDIIGGGHFTYHW